MLKLDSGRPLYFGKFNYQINNEYVNYALQLFSIAKNLDLSMREAEIVLNVVRHFKPPAGRK